MDPFTLGLLALIAAIVLIALGVPLAFSIGSVAIVGNIIFFDINRSGIQLYNSVFGKGTDFLLASVPLFIFMGQLVAVGNIGRDLYDCVYKWFGRVPGGLAVTSVVTSAGFGAVTGVSAAAVATVATLSMPEMKRYNYNMRLAAGSIATASTLAILVPPSLMMILFGLWTETSIGRLFMAGVIPAVLLTVMFCVYIVARCTLRPEDGPVGPGYPMSDRLAALPKLIPVILIFVIVMGGIYSGTFTPSEAAGVGAFTVLALLLLMRRLTWQGFVQAAVQTGQISLMIFAIFIAVGLFTSFLVLTNVTPTFVNLIAGSGLNKYLVILMIVVMFLILGMILDPIGMLLLSLPFVFPLAMRLGFDPVWFGIICVLMVEIALVTPPVGFNCFILKQVAGDMVELKDVFLGTLPFVIMSLLLVALLVAFPGLVLWLPNQFF
ncbi:MAG: TRAP transporter large permease [Gemmobacter sp.]|nr:TRAP transporter large permease [Gemmobacter sp.]